MADFSGLSIRGDVVTADDSGWDEARQAWNLAADQQPEAVALVQSADDVSKVIRFAAANGLKVAGQGTGHGAVALGPLEGVILIKTERMRDVVIEGDKARAEAGALSEEVADAAAASGMCSMPGTSPNVGVVGYTLGGGLSWLGRKYGWACNRISAIELVTADGEPRTVDATTDPDLFWALRGGGGGYAIVTAIHIELLPIKEVYAGALLLPAELAREGLHTWRRWAAEAPEEVSSLARLMNLPPIPDVPEPLRGKKFLQLNVACIGTKEDGEAAVAPLREIGEPIMDMIDQIPASGLTRIAQDPEPPVPGLGHHALLDDLTDEAIDAFYDVAGPESDSPLLLAELRQLGGALARPAQGGGALDKIDAAFVMFGIGMLMDPAMKDPIDAHLDRMGEAMKPWVEEGGYFNYAERACDVDAILPPEICERLGHVKRSWDPDDLIRANHSVALAPA